MIDQVKPPRKVRLGKWQVKALEMILTHQACCSHSLLAIIIGAAKKWDRRYKRSLRHAIEAHNSHRAVNSPIPQNIQIIEAAAGSDTSKNEKCGFILRESAII